jgi:hypothetical protein
MRAASLLNVAEWFGIAYLRSGQDCELAQVWQLLDGGERGGLAASHGAGPNWSGLSNREGTRQRNRGPLGVSELASGQRANRSAK